MRKICQGIIFTAAHLATVIFIYGNVLADANRSSGNVYWLKFSEKAAGKPIAVSERALARRMVRASIANHFWHDLPVKSEYLEDLRKRGIRIRNISRWLNAVSAVIPPEKIGQIAQLPYIAEITRVSSYSRPRTIPAPEAYPDILMTAGFDYGPSWNQINMITVDSLHNLGLSGGGVLIGVMDTGFDTSHAVFSHLRSGGKIVATYDFINGDPDVMDQPDVQRSHGTEVLSVLAGFNEGSLIGPAYGADFVLAKTELVFQEIQAEEDNWIAAAEWMESLGVDIISSSLGYIDWYDTTQLDGRTAAITQAANAAVSLGVIAVNAAGNEGDTFWRKVIPPSDGDSVIAVGAVDRYGEIALFSSRGPTADGRIKPDFCAQGMSVYMANWAGGYGSAGGTSFATPLMAGGIALLLEGHPQWTLADIFRALKTASSHRYLPNNTYGWGTPDFTAAYYEQTGSTMDSAPSILIAPHPAVDSVFFYLSAKEAGRGELSIHDPAGTPIKRVAFTVDAPGTIAIVWDGENDSGQKAASGIYLCVFTLGGRETVEKFFLVSNR